jgi:uncharacterized protein
MSSSSSLSISADVTSDLSYRAVAPAWHTVIVLIILFASSLAGALAGSITPGSRGHGRAPGYLLIIASEWLVVAFIWWGAHRRGFRMADLVGGKWARVGDVFRDLGIAVAFLIVSALVLNGVGYLMKASSNSALRDMLPRTATEVALWVLLSLTAGFCEELIFRGYLFRQFSALTRSSAGGLVLQGIAFGAGHGYQGWKLMLLIAVYGCMFGLLAQWRRSLRPGMITHSLQDGVTGIVARHFMK